MGRFTIHQTDSNQSAIVDALHAVGATVFRLGDRGLPDLLIARAGRLWLAEVKTRTGKMRASQLKVAMQLDRAFVTVHILRSVDDALKLIGVRAGEARQGTE